MSALKRLWHYYDPFFYTDERSVRFQYRAICINSLIYTLIAFVYFVRYSPRESPNMSGLVVLSVWMVVLAWKRLTPFNVVSASLPGVHALLVHWACTNAMGERCLLFMVGPLVLFVAAYTSFPQTLFYAVVSLLEFLLVRSYWANDRELSLFYHPHALWDMIDEQFAWCFIHLALITRYSFVFHRLQTHVRGALEKETIEVKRKQHLLADTTHEIRSPMTAIFHIAELLSGENAADVHRALIVSLQTACRSLMKFLNQMIDSSHMDSQQVRCVTFDLHAMLADGTMIFHAAARLKGLRIGMEIMPSVPRFAKGDQYFLKKILLNLVGNSVKFTTSGSVKVTASGENRRGQLILVVRVTDTGPGFQLEGIQHSEIFEPYFRADRSQTHRAYGNTGLGLSICRQAIDKLNGHISLVQTSAAGSEFLFEVPLERLAPSEAAQALEAERVVDVRQPSRELSRSDNVEPLLAWAGDVGDDLAERLLAVPVAEVTAAAGHALRSEGSDPMVESGGKAAGLLQRSEVSEAGGGGAGSAGGAGNTESRVLDRTVESTSGSSHEKTVTDASTAVPERLNILFVEDTSLIRRLVRMSLEKAGHRCATAENGVKGYEQFQESISSNKPFDVIAMDIHMDVCNGYQSSRMIREEEKRRGSPRVPIIAVTANTTRDCRDECAASGMDAIVEKPFETPVLLEAIRGVLAEGAPQLGRFSLFNG